MIEKNPEAKKILKKNIKFAILVIIFSLIAWFGVKMLVSKSSASTSTSTKKSSSLIQTSAGLGGGAPSPANGSGGGFRNAGN